MPALSTRWAYSSRGDEVVKFARYGGFRSRGSCWRNRSVRMRDDRRQHATLRARAAGCPGSIVQYRSVDFLPASLWAAVTVTQRTATADSAEDDEIEEMHATEHQ